MPRGGQNLGFASRYEEAKRLGAEDAEVEILDGFARQGHPELPVSIETDAEVEGWLEGYNSRWDKELQDGGHE